MGNRTIYKTCRHCGRTREEAGWLSNRGLCVECGESRQVDAIREMATKSGPTYDKWRQGVIDAASRPVPTSPTVAVNASASTPKRRKTA